MKRKTDSEDFVSVILLAGAVNMFSPFYWLVRSSFMKIEQIFRMPPEWIRILYLKNYKQAFTLLPFGQYFLNTIIIVAAVMAGTL